MTTRLNKLGIESPTIDSVQRIQTESITNATVIGVERGKHIDRVDSLAVEEPLAIAITHGPPNDRRRSTISITMRTPADDRDLVAGFLFSEGVVRYPDEILAVEVFRSRKLSAR